MLIILRGNSGSGKTTVAKALQRRLGRGTLLVSQDAVRRDMLWAKDGEDTLALPLLADLLRYGRAHCAHVILEGILNAGWYAPLFEAARELFGADIFAYYYDLPFEETLARHQTKGAEPGFGEEDMRRWWKRRDLIGAIPEVIFTREVSLDGAVDRICEDIGRGRR